MSRMTGQQRRQQLLNVAREVFAERGYEATSVEEIAQRAKVSKPIVYEHFGGKEGLHAVLVDREMNTLLERVTSALKGGKPAVMLEQAASALLSYIEEEPEGFRLLVRDAPVGVASGTFASLIGDIAIRVEHVLAAQFKMRGYDPKLAPLYSQALVGMVAQVGQWWLDNRRPSRKKVAAHLVNLAWNGLSRLDPEPRLSSPQKKRAIPPKEERLPMVKRPAVSS